jgi:hypothetical protein
MLYNQFVSISIQTHPDQEQTRCLPETAQVVELVLDIVCHSTTIVGYAEYHGIGVVNDMYGNPRRQGFFPNKEFQTFYLDR